MAIETMQHIASGAVDVDRELTSVLGDRLALWRFAFITALGDASAEMHASLVVESDAAGHISAQVAFDVDDRTAADDELWSRFDASGEGRFRAPVRERARRAFNRHDLGALRATLADGFVFEDRRKTSIGLLNADEYVASVAALGGREPDVLERDRLSDRPGAVGRGRHGPRRRHDQSGAPLRTCSFAVSRPTVRRSRGSPSSTPNRSNERWLASPSSGRCRTSRR